MSDATDGGGSAAEEPNSEVIDSEVECPVCMKLLVDATSTPCGHTFCKLCLEESFMRRSTCPLCRMRLTAEECKDDRILRKMIEKLYPKSMKQRRSELQRCVEDDDLDHWTRKRESMQAALSEGNATADCIIIWQNPSFSLPCPGEDEDLYFENPELTAVVDTIYRNSRCGFVLLPWSNQPPPANQIGVLVRVIFYTSLSGSGTHVNSGDEWVPPRLKLQRVRFRDNKIELYPQVRQSSVVKAKCIGRVRVSHIDCPENGPCKGICTGLAEPICEQNSPERAETVRLKAVVLRTRIAALLDDMGQAGRLLYTRRFGELPAVPGRCGISQLEDISFAFMIPLAIPPHQKNELLRFSSTEDRLDSMLKLINASGTTLIRMGLTQSSSGEWLSRMFLGGWNQSIVLFIILAIGLALVRSSDYYSHL